MKTVIEMARLAGIDDLVYRLRKRAEIRRQILGRKSVEEGKPDRIADILEEAADAIADEREACANIAHQWSKREDDVGGYIEAAIRARSNT